MKILALFLLGLAVTMGMPIYSGEAHGPLVEDVLPDQAHMVVEDPAPQVDSKEQPEKMAPVPVDMEQSQSTVELEVKMKPEMGEKEEGEVETKAEKDPQIKPESEVKVEPEVKVEQEVKPEPEVKVEPKEVEPEVKVEQEVKPEPEVKVEPKEVEPEVKVEQEVKVEPKEVEPEVMAEKEVNVNPAGEIEQELKENPDFEVESEVKVESDVEEETKPEVEPSFNEEEEVEESFQVPVNPPEKDQEFDEGYNGMEEKSDMEGEPTMELEPLDDDSMFGDELANAEMEKSLREDPEGQGLMRKRYNVLFEEPIMELEPEMTDLFDMEEEPEIDVIDQKLLPLEDYFHNEEDRVRMEAFAEDDSDYIMMEEPGAGLGREIKS